MGYLDAAKTVIPDAQKAIIKAALDAMHSADIIRSQIDYDKEYQKLIRIAADANQNMTSVKVPEDAELMPIIRSNMLNTLLLALYLDMNGVYFQTNVADTIIQRHQNISQSDWRSALTAVRKHLLGMPVCVCRWGHPFQWTIDH